MAEGRRLSFGIPVALAWGLLLWRGGLEAWQPALAALVLALFLWRERARVPGFGAWSAFERVLALALLVAALGIAVSLRPQATLNAVAGLGLAFTIALVFRRQTRTLAPHVADFWMLGGALAAAVFIGGGLVGWFFGLDSVHPLDAARWFFPNQNLLAGGLILPALLLGLTRLGRPRGGRAPALFCVLLGVLALVFAGSRGAYFAFVAGSLWIVGRSLGGKRSQALLVRWTLLAMLFMGLLALWAPFSRLAVRMREQSTAGEQDDNYYRRKDFWVGALKLSSQRPLLGYGLNTFGAAAARLDLPTELTSEEPIARYRLALDHAHNDWLELAVETGWPLTLVLLLLCAAAWKWRRWRLASPDPDHLGLEAVLLAALTLSLVDMNLRTPGIAFGLMLSFCALEQKPWYRAPSKEASWPGAAKAALGLALVALLCLGGSWIARLCKAGRGAGPTSSTLLTAASFLQPLDASLAVVGAQEQGSTGWPWTAWAGRQDPGWWWYRANVAGKEGDRAVQEADARQAVALRPYFAPGWFWLGQILGHAGQAADAEPAMARALSLEPNFCRVLAWQAGQAQAKGDAAGAQALVRRILAIQPLRGVSAPADYTRYIQSVDPAWLEQQIQKHP